MPLLHKRKIKVTRWLRSSLLALLGYFVILEILWIPTGCANVGRVIGGIKDTIPPQISYAQPPNKSTHFSDKEIYVYFDEYVISSDLKKQLIISPPFEKTPLIKPTNVARDHVYINLEEHTLRDSTTYTFNFGRAIKDFNEGNELVGFSYVLSTGSYVDSLSVAGYIREMKSDLPAEDKALIMLHEVDTGYTDSTVYNLIPDYISYPKPKSDTFQIENIKAGEYHLVALIDENNNFKFDPKTDQIGFLDSSITLPTDTKFTLKTFKEVPEFRPLPPTHIEYGKVYLNFEGKPDSLTIERLEPLLPDTTRDYIQYSRTGDTVTYWYEPVEELKKISFLWNYQDSIDTISVRLKTMEQKPLMIKPTSDKLNPEQIYSLEFGSPILCSDTSYIRLFRRDSSMIDYQMTLDQKKMKATINFETQVDSSYLLVLYPGAFEDVLYRSHDTLSKQIKVGNPTEYGKLFLSIKHQKPDSIPFILELTDNAFKPIHSSYYTSHQKEYIVPYLRPNQYYARITYDINHDGEWTTGSYLTHTQPEPVIYYPTSVEIKPDWEVEIEWDTNKDTKLDISKKENKR